MIKLTLRSTFVLVALILFVSGCSAAKSEPSEQTELVVFAAASMTESLTEIGALFSEAHPDIKLVFSFDSSGTLKTQIEEGADCDLFISASSKQMDALDISADSTRNPDGLDFVQSDTRRDILENQVVLCVPSGNPAGITSFNDLAARLAAGDVFFAMGNSDVPVGQYTQKILVFYGLDETALAETGSVTYASNVKEVVTQIAEKTVDCGVVYCTDAASANLTIIDTATPEMCGRAVYPAAVLKTAKNTDAAKLFLDFLSTESAADIFNNVGFKPLT